MQADNVGTSWGPPRRGVLAMAVERLKASATREWPLSAPATVVAGAAFVALLALGLARLAPGFLVPLRAVLIVAALLAAGAAVWWRLRAADEEFEDRVWASVIVVSAAAVLLCCREAMDEEWDSLRMALGVFFVVAMAGAAVVVLPSLGRRIVASLLLLFHFGGILTAVTSPAPHNGAPGPYLPSALWSLV